MHKYAHPLWLAGSVSLLCTVIPSPTQAQIIRDVTLGKESSVITPKVKIKGIPSARINGGAIRGTNLFHSFEQFNIDPGEGAYFTNPAGVKNILSRVTGSSRSDILGTLGVLGNANLFLINPRGILFGPNASLDINGSFVVTTANAVGLGDTGLFSASEPAASNLLTIDPSAFFFNTLAAQAVVNQSQAESLREEPNSVGGPVGLQVPTGQTLALVGGDVLLEGGNLTAAGGRIELGSVADVGKVNLNQTGDSWILSYSDVNAFGEIRLEDGALVDASGEGGGGLQIQGANLMLTQGAAIFADTLGAEAGKEVRINTTETVMLSENSLITAEVYGSGTGGNLTIDTGRLILQNAFKVSTYTSGQGQGGDLTVSATEAVQLLGLNEFGQPSRLNTGTDGFASAGKLTIDTERLFFQDGAQATTTTFGEQKAGDLTVRASVVELAGAVVVEFPDGFKASFSSGLLTTADQGSKGNSGDLTIDAEQLIVRDGAQVATTSFGEGSAGNLTVTASEVKLIGTGADAESASDLSVSGLFAGADTNSTGLGGDLTIETDRLIIQDGAVAQTSTLGKENAGDLIVNASESIELIGRTPNGLTPSGLLAVSGLENIFTEAQGQGGDIKIATPQLLVQDGATIAVSSINPTSAAKGAGNIKVTAPTISLDNGDITAATASGNGGNIAIQVPDLLLLRRDSNISTSAGSAKVDGDGGNIKINTDFIIAVSQENSDITANAFSGSGGKVDIEVQGNIFGLEPRSRQELQELIGTDDPSELDPSQLPSNDITAISQTNPSLDGLVTINTPDVDPSEEIANLPTEPVNTEIAQDCQAGGEKGTSRFISSGSGGLPTNPYEPLNSRDILVDVQLPAQWVDKADTGTQSTGESPTRSNGDMRIFPRQRMPLHRVSAAGQANSPNQIVEAQAWSVNQTGEVALVAETPQHNSSQNGCRPH